MDKDTKEMFDLILNKLDGMDKKIDDNHKEVMGKLKILEDNQVAIRSYIINADDTFKKVEDDHKFIERLKNVVNS